MQSPSGCPVKYIICQLKQIVKYENRPGTTRNGNIMAVAKKLPSGSWRCQGRYLNANKFHGVFLLSSEDRIVS